MSTSAISNLVNNPLPQFQQQLPLLTTNLQSGNSNAAQPDLVELHSIALQPPLASPIQGIKTLKQEFNQLGQDLQSGNISAAQQDYTKLQQDLQTQSPQSPASHGHHHHESSFASNQFGSSQSDSQSHPVSDLFDQLGRQIQSGSLTQAQQTFAMLQQNLESFDLSPSQGDALSPAIAAVSVSV
ncbi:MAG TPA: hypothetical protein VMH04_10145 [Candidatus Solibacter sp.]|nr:hypothetical protein [Candidatus Solibacter sp.]